ncbi:hypothetical protein ACFQ3P_40915 [Paraburkholderia sabiae]|uniref:Uncharacterized protein n=1 Tax=Paraburkholderia sabiae TaxID=273251 RepID=A0ABU9QLX2_9BURK|nr:hypothetical protein [Paraburkholderia sabiae]WJZ77278.1 hypothetical protein QEN71_34965 [Paraburkholderia sabiae]CAD6548219.1 hypothetical protein LMG24235_04546 [Paraburkholderia sabiae]
MIRRALDAARAAALFALLAGAHVWAAGTAIDSGDAAATRAADITRDYGLSKDKTECLLFDTADKGRYFLVRVRENHSASCGGEPGVSPVLFFLRIRKRDGYTVTTAYDGERYRPLKARSND